MLAKSALSSPDSWSQFVGDVLRTYNTNSLHRITKLAPDVVFFVSITKTAQEAFQVGLDETCYAQAVDDFFDHQSLKIECTHEVHVREFSLNNSHTS